MIYKITYLPVALEDLRDIIGYLSINLASPDAALTFISSIEEASLILQQFPYSQRVYEPVKSLNFEYRLLPVKNTAHFYIFKGDIVEIYRILYGRRDFTQHVK